MQVCFHHGLLIAVLSRNEHCPPHVHVGDRAWDARFKFSFWHNSVNLWDVSPAKNSPSASLLEDLRQVVRLDTNLRRARELWWTSRGTLCIDNQEWDPAQQEVVSPKLMRPGAMAILAAKFDMARNSTFLTLAGQGHPLEIKL